MFSILFKNFDVKLTVVAHKLQLYKLDKLYPSIITPMNHNNLNVPISKCSYDLL